MVLQSTILSIFYGQQNVCSANFEMYIFHKSLQNLLREYIVNQLFPQFACFLSYFFFKKSCSSSPLHDIDKKFLKPPKKIESLAQEDAYLCLLWGVEV